MEPKTPKLQEISGDIFEALIIQETLIFKIESVVERIDRESIKEQESNPVKEKPPETLVEALRAVKRSIEIKNEKLDYILNRFDNLV